MLDNRWMYKISMVPSYVEVLAALGRFYQWQHVFYLYDNLAGT